MKILHLCLGCFYIDNYTYQENLLPKYHKKMGYDVEIIASLITFDKNGKGTLLKHGGEYINENGISVTRLEYKKSLFNVNTKLKKFVGLYDKLINSKPDIIFIHGCQFCDMKYVVEYLKTHPNIKVFVDNHADYSNSATNWFSKNILHKLVWKKCAEMIEPYTLKFYGVLPARVDFLVDLYKLPKEKCDFLPMGVDDDTAQENDSNSIKEKVRKEHGISNDDFLIVTGGKIDEFKKQTLTLMDAVNNIDNPKIKLIVFGSVINELKDEVNKRCSGKVKYIGWLNSSDTYKYFSSCDLAVFPGRHSVIWEQVAGQGIPMIVKYWDGTTHIDLGGNVRFLHKDTEEEITDNILYAKENINNMKQNAISKSKKFKYSEIAKISIEL